MSCNKPCDFECVISTLPLINTLIKCMHEQLKPGPFSSSSSSSSGLGMRLAWHLIELGYGFFVSPYRYNIFSTWHNSLLPHTDSVQCIHDLFQHWQIVKGLATEVIQLWLNQPPILCASIRLIHNLWLSLSYNHICSVPRWFVTLRSSIFLTSLQNAPTTLRRKAWCTKGLLLLTLAHRNCLSTSLMHSSLLVRTVLTSEPNTLRPFMVLYSHRNYYPCRI